jgi:hypothetical protein
MLANEDWKQRYAPSHNATQQIMMLYKFGASLKKKKIIYFKCGLKSFLDYS